MESERQAFENDWSSALTGLKVKNPWEGEGGTCTPYNGLYGEAPSERGIFFRLVVDTCKRIGISRAEV